MPKLGPYFWIDEGLIFHALPLAECENRASNKKDNPYQHENLYDDYFVGGEYIDYPRGRVVWDCTNNRAIVYIDKCINNLEVLAVIAKAFELTEYAVEYDLHYHCKDCVDEIWDN